MTQKGLIRCKTKQPTNQPTMKVDILLNKETKPSSREKMRSDENLKRNRECLRWIWRNEEGMRDTNKKKIWKRKKSFIFRISKVWSTQWESNSLGLLIKLNYFVSMMVRVFTNGPVQSHVESYQRLEKWYLMPPWCLRIKIRIKGKWSIQGNEYCCPLHLSVVAIEKGAFGSPSTTVANVLHISKRSWCYGYRCKKWTRWLEFKSKIMLFTSYSMTTTILSVWFLLGV